MTEVAAVPPAAFTAARVYQAIAAVTAEIGKEGIAKERNNTEQKYTFRGIDDVYNALSPIIARHNLCILPRVLSRDVSERKTKSGSPLFSVTVEVEFDFVSAEDGSKHIVKTYGEAMDTADKATNKAMSAAYKYAAMQAFCIPTEGDNDADAVTHALAGSEPVGDKRSRYASKDIDKQMREEIDACQTVEELQGLWNSKPFRDELLKHPEEWEKSIVDYFNERLEDHRKSPPRKPAGYVAPEFEKLTPAVGDHTAQFKASVAMEKLATELRGAKSPEQLKAIWDAKVQAPEGSDARKYLQSAYADTLKKLGLVAVE